MRQLCEKLTMAIYFSPMWMTNRINYSWPFMHPCGIPADVWFAPGAAAWLTASVTPGTWWQLTLLGVDASIELNRLNGKYGNPKLSSGRNNLWIKNNVSATRNVKNRVSHTVQFLRRAGTRIWFGITGGNPR